MTFEGRYLIKNTAMAITSITHALNTPPRVTGMILGSWPKFSGFAFESKKKHLDHIGFDNLHEIILHCKLPYF